MDLHITRDDGKQLVVKVSRCEEIAALSADRDEWRTQVAVLVEALRKIVGENPNGWRGQADSLRQARLATETLANLPAAAHSPMERDAKIRALIAAARRECSCPTEPMAPCPRHNAFPEGAHAFEVRLAALDDK